MPLKYDGVPDHIRVSLMTQEQWREVRDQYYSGRGMNEELATEVLLKVKGVFESVGCRFFLTSGTALGFYREGNFIPWDDEIDIDVFAEELAPHYFRIVSSFIDLGFIVRTGPRLENSKMALFYKGMKISIGGVYWESENPEYRQGVNYQWPCRFYENATKFSYKGTEYLLPGPKEEYLTFVYGKNWRTPIQSDDVNEYMDRSGDQFKADVIARRQGLSTFRKLKRPLNFLRNKLFGWRHDS
jgi:hypothetical protein